MCVEAGEINCFVLCVLFLEVCISSGYKRREGVCSYSSELAVSPVGMYAENEINPQKPKRSITLPE